MSQALFDYYQSIIPEPQRWHDVVSDRLPITFWVNTLKTTPQKVCEYLAEDGIETTPIAWHSSAFRVSNQHKLGRHWTYLAGLIQIQEEVSMLSGIILQPHPGEQVLDLCAAPGNKTAQMAVSMQNQGTLIANDPNYHRMRALSQVIKRFGLTNISMTLYDGGSYPRLPNYFDKIMVDAPCSCEGTLRKRSRDEKMPNRASSLALAKTQFHILSKAIKLCKKGGQLLYSTCTFSPEENEGVIHRALTEFGDAIRIIPIELPHFHLSPGITTWKEQHYHHDVVHTRRVWPHLNDTGGFYLALIEKVQASPTPKVPSKSFANPSDQAQTFIQLQCQHFGIDEVALKTFHFTDQLSKRGIYITNADNQPPSEMQYDTHGVFFLKTQFKYPKLSTAAAGLLGAYATKNIIHLKQSQRHAYLMQEDVLCDEVQTAICTPLSYVILFFDENVLGLGLLSSDKKTLKSLFPKHLLNPNTDQTHNKNT